MYFERFISFFHENESNILQNVSDGVDERDLKIYQILRKNGRARLTEIARELGLSHPSVKERLEKLISRRDIMIKALLNIEKRGFKCAVVNLQIESMEEAVKLADIFAKCPRTIFVAPTTGKYNLNIALIAESNSLLEATIENTIRHLKNVKSMDVSIGEAPAYPEFVDLKISPRGK